MYPEDPASAPIAQVRFSTEIRPPEAAPWWRRKPTTQTMAVGAAGAMAFAIVLGLVLTPKDRSAGAAAEAEAPVASPAGMVEQFRFQKASGAYQAPSQAEVSRAFGEARQTFQAGGVSGLARAGLDCYRRLERQPAYGLMDYCIAFDLFAEAENGRLIGGQTPSATSWFGSAAARQLNVAQSVMGMEGDAAARLLDLRRMAAELSAARGGPPLTAPGSVMPSAPAVTHRTVAAAEPRNDQLGIEVVEAVPQALPRPIPVAAPRPAPARRPPPAEVAPEAAPLPREPAPEAPTAEPAPAPLVEAPPLVLPPPAN